MSRNFRQSQLLDAFDFDDSNNRLGRINVDHGPASLDNIPDVAYERIPALPPVGPANYISVIGTDSLGGTEQAETAEYNNFAPNTIRVVGNNTVIEFSNNYTNLHYVPTGQTTPTNLVANDFVGFYNSTATGDIGDSATTIGPFRVVSIDYTATPSTITLRGTIPLDEWTGTGGRLENADMYYIPNPGGEVVMPSTGQVLTWDGNNWTNEDPEHVMTGSSPIQEYSSTTTYNRGDLVVYTSGDSSTGQTRVWQALETFSNIAPSFSATIPSGNVAWVPAGAFFAPESGTSATQDLHYVTFPSQSTLAFGNGIGPTRPYRPIPSGNSFPAQTGNTPAAIGDFFYLIQNMAGTNTVGLYRLSEGTPPVWVKINATSLTDLSDVDITPNARTFNDVQNPIDSDDAVAGDYIPASGIFRFTPQNMGARASFVVNTPLVFTLATTIQAAVADNTLFTGTVTRSEQIGSGALAREVVEITIDTGASRAFFTREFTTPSADGFVVPVATIETWRAWEETTDDVGIGIFRGNGTLTNFPYGTNGQYLTIDNNQLAWEEGGLQHVTSLPTTAGAIGDVVSLTQVDGSDGIGLYRRTATTTGDKSVWTRVGEEENITFTTALDPTEPTATYTGVTYSRQTTDPNNLDLTFANEGEAIAFVSFVSAPHTDRALRNWTVEFRAAGVSIGQPATATWNIPMNTDVGQTGGATAVIEFATFPSGLVDQTTAGTLSFGTAHEDHVSSTRFNLVGTDGIDVDVSGDSSNATITIGQDTVRVNGDALESGRHITDFTNSNTISFNSVNDSVSTDQTDIRASVRANSLNLAQLQRDNSNFTPGRVLTVGTNNQLSTTDSSQIVDHEFTPLARTVTWTTSQGFPASRWYSSAGPDPDTTSNTGGFTNGQGFVTGVQQGIPEITSTGNVIGNVGQTGVDPLRSILDNNFDFVDGRVYGVEIGDETGTTFGRIDRFVDSSGNDLTGEQALFFRATGVSRTGELVATQMWETPNLVVGDPVDPAQEFIGIRVSDYGIMNDAMLAPFGSQGIDFTTNTNQTISISSPTGITNITNELTAGNRVFMDVSAATGVPTGSLMEVVAASNTEVTLAPHVFNLNTGEAIPTAMLPENHVDFSPSNAALYTFNQLNPDDFVTKEVHELTVTGAMGGQQIPTEQQITLSVPSGYTLNVDGSREPGQTGTFPAAGSGMTALLPGQLRSGSTPVLIDTVNGGILTLDIAPGSTVRGTPLTISPFPSGYPYAPVLTNRIGNVNVFLGATVGVLPAGRTTLFQPNDRVFISEAATETSLNFRVTGGGFDSVLPITRNNFEGRTPPFIDRSAEDFLDELAALIITLYSPTPADPATAWTIRSAASTDTTTGMTSVVIDTNQPEDLDVIFTLSDESLARGTDAPVNNPMGAINTNYVLEYMNPLDSADNRNFSISVMTPLITRDALVSEFETEIRNTASGWDVVRESNVLTLVSRDTRPFAAQLVPTVTEPPANPGSLTLISRNISDGGNEINAFGRGILLDPNTGVISTEATDIRVIDGQTASEGDVSFTASNTFIFGPGGGDAGVSANNIINAMFITRPAMGTAEFLNAPLDRDIFVRYQQGTTDNTHLVRAGTPITYVPNPVPTLTIGNTFDALGALAAGTISVFADEQFTGEINFRAGEGIVFNTDPADNVVEIAQVLPQNPTSTTEVTSQELSAIQNGRVRFGDWLLTNGFAFPNVTEEPGVSPGGITITIATAGMPDVMPMVEVYRINNQDYYFVPDFFGGAWIAGTLADGQTIDNTELQDRIISSFSTTQ